MFCFDPPRWTLRKIDSDMQDKLKSEGVARLGDSIDDSDRGSPMCRTIRSRENGGATNRELRCPRYIQHRTPTPNCYTTSPGSKIHLPGRTIKKKQERRMRKQGVVGHLRDFPGPAASNDSHLSCPSSSFHEPVLGSRSKSPSRYPYRSSRSFRSGFLNAGSIRTLSPGW